MQEYAPTVLRIITTRSGIKKAIKREEILVDGKVGQTSDWIQENQVIQLIQKERKAKKIFNLHLEILYEDEFLAVIHKPAGYPTSGNYFKTVENALPNNLKPSAVKDALPYPMPVHRLDTPTSGLLLIAKTRKVQVQLNQEFEIKKIKKFYVAMVEGEFPAHAIYQQAIDDQPATSKVTCISLFKLQHKRFSMLQIEPETGRTHQIRKHLSMNGFPIVGDKLYGSTEKISSGKKEIFLAATKLIFTHPVKAEELIIEMELPKHFSVFTRL